MLNLDIILHERSEVKGIKNRHKKNFACPYMDGCSCVCLSVCLSGLKS